MAEARRPAVTPARAAVGGGVAAAIAQAVAALMAWGLGAAEVPAEVIAQLELAVFTAGTAALIGLGTWARDRGGAIGATLGVLGLVAVLAASGCAFQITGEGLQASMGQAEATTCDSVVGEGEDAAGEGCATANGGKVSEQGASLLQPLFSLFGGIGKLLLGMGGA